MRDYLRCTVVIHEGVPSRKQTLLRQVFFFISSKFTKAKLSTLVDNKKAETKVSAFVGDEGFERCSRSQLYRHFLNFKN